MVQEWYYASGGQQRGPVNAQQLKQLATSGQLQSTDLVWCDGMPAWVKASTVQGLFVQNAPLKPPSLPSITAPSPISFTPSTPQSSAQAVRPELSSQPPNAQAATPGIKGSTPPWIWIVLGGVGVVVLLCCGGPMVFMAGLGDRQHRAGQTKTSQNEQAIRVSALELISAYKDNEVAADERYKGGVLEVSGMTDSIGKDILDTMHVVLKGGGEFEFRGVQCSFDDKHKGSLANLSKGQFITIRGKCEGLMGNVQLRECEIVN
jgi:hypothetical protein